MQVGASVRGDHVRTLLLEPCNKRSNYGLALDPPRNRFAVSNWQFKSISVYDLTTGDHQRTFGREGRQPCEFRDPCKICFAENGNILVAEDSNRRLQEVTVEGAHVRFIGVGTIDGTVYGICANQDVIVATKYDPGVQVYVFDYATGSLLRGFGSNGTTEGQMRACICTRFLPGDTRLVMGEMDSRRLSVFNVDGTFDHVIDLSEYAHTIRDVEVTRGGEIVVADGGEKGNQVIVMSESGTVQRTFRIMTVDNEKTTCPNSLAYHNGELYVLDRDDNRVLIYR